jgi:hypothetical protein
MADDYYTLLKVSRGASAEEIEDALRQRLMIWSRRASNAPKAADRHEAEQQVELLGQAKTILTDPARRAQYDHTLAGDQPEQVPWPIPHRNTPDPWPNFQSNPHYDQQRAPYRKVTSVSAHWPRAIITLFLFWPVGIAACVFAAQVKPALLIGDVQSALRASNRVKMFSRITAAVYVIFVLIIIIAAVASSQHSGS